MKEHKIGSQQTEKKEMEPRVHLLASGQMCDWENFTRACLSISSTRREKNRLQLDYWTNISSSSNGHDPKQTAPKSPYFSQVLHLFFIRLPDEFSQCKFLNKSD